MGEDGLKNEQEQLVVKALDVNRALDAEIDRDNPGHAAAVSRQGNISATIQNR